MKAVKLLLTSEAYEFTLRNLSKVMSKDSTCLNVGCAEELYIRFMEEAEELKCA